MYTLINGSPKINNSNSMHFLNIIDDNLEKTNVYSLKKDKYEEIIQSLNLSDTIVLAFPLYVDSPTSITLEFLDYLYDNKIYLNEKKVYVVINCGFREGEQNITGVNIIKIWCEKVKAIYSGSILIGAGEIVGKDKYKIICKDAMKKLKIFCNMIKSKENCDDIITTMDLINNKIYCYLANKSWNKRGKKNNLKVKEIKAI